ncbi:hypothetical protein DYB26_005471 [Aphanomyces astaci]|uniref:Cilia- and flagella-associated protein 69 ARM repeats domain-containing protein n=1 Tax=Aphanomyces astaci TaxID=112090 RepID=A0A3R6Z4Y3_APHAT|nr:hypothetical protein DYB26_005471 [Aphanomyces astaci]
MKARAALSSTAVATIEPTMVDDAGSAADFRKILDTFQDKQTADLYSRQVALLQVLVQKFPSGFKMQDLPEVEAILRVAYEKIEAGVDVLIEPVCLGHPPRQSGNSDDHSDDQRPLPRDYSQQLVERCGIVEASAAALQRLLDDQEASDDANRNKRMDLLLFPIVDLLQEISSWGPNAQILTAHGSHDRILDILDQIDDLRDEFLPLCLEILWNVLEISATTTATIQSCRSRAVMLHALRTTNAIHAMGSLRTFQVLHKLLQRLLVHGYRKQDKELR